MTSTSTRAVQSRPNADRMHDIEGKHFGRCVDQVWGYGRRTLIELMDYPKARCQAVIVKQFDGAAPRSGSGKPWPDLLSCYVYVPVDDASNTWEGLDRALDAYETKNRAQAVDEMVDDAGKLLGV